jgi:endonuclease/exonuclease/phosphatase family metal-dependent hydrolase
VALLIRSWNVFHGNSSPPGRRSHLRTMVELATADGPDVLCLQEMPLWALPRLGRWSHGMTARWSVARRPWLPAWLGGAITRLNQGLLRSAISGQANAMLLRPPLRVLDHRERQISEGRRERRTCHAVRAPGLVVANLHATNSFLRHDVPGAELVRAAGLVDELAQDGDVCVLAGDFNLRAGEIEPLRGWSPFGPGIDHVLVRGAASAPVTVWPEQRRIVDGKLLSDHAPVETRVG